MKAQEKVVLSAALASLREKCKKDEKLIELTTQVLANLDGAGISYADWMLENLGFLRSPCFKVKESDLTKITDAIGPLNIVSKELVYPDKRRHDVIVTLESENYPNCWFQYTYKEKAKRERRAIAKQE